MVNNAIPGVYDKSSAGSGSSEKPLVPPAVSIQHELCGDILRISADNRHVPSSVVHTRIVIIITEVPPRARWETAPAPECRTQRHGKWCEMSFHVFYLIPFLDIGLQCRPPWLFEREFRFCVAAVSFPRRFRRDAQENGDLPPTVMNKQKVAKVVTVKTCHITGPIRRYRLALFDH